MEIQGTPRCIFAVAYLGLEFEKIGGPLCDFNVTHIPSGRSWTTQRSLKEWVKLNFQLTDQVGSPAQQSTDSTAAGFLSTAKLHSSKTRKPATLPAHPCGHQQSGMSELMVLQVQFEDLQAQLSEHLYNADLEEN